MVSGEKEVLVNVSCTTYEQPATCQQSVNLPGTDMQTSMPVTAEVSCTRDPDV